MRRLFAVAALLAAAAGGYLVGRAGERGAVGRGVRFVEAPVGGLATPQPIELPHLADRPVRNLILAVGDGMGIAEVAAARYRAFGAQGRFVFERLPVVSLVASEPTDRLIAKSESAATALATGVRGPVGRVSLAEDGTPLPTLLERAAAAGWAIGLTTSSRVYDATPAAFYAHVPRRRDYESIVAQLAASPIDLVAGGGVEGVASEWTTAAQRRGVTLAFSVEELAGADRLPLWALFPGMRLGEEPLRPTIGELTSKAIDLLAAEGARRGTGFFLLVEEEGIDTAAHDNDLDRMAEAALRFDAAVASAVQFAAADGETLLVVVGDHETGGVVVDDGRQPGTMRVTWVTTGHAGGPVALFAYGPESAQRALAGPRDLAELGRLLMALLLERQ